MEKKMLLQDISDYIAIRENVTKKKAETFVKTMFEVIVEGLTRDSFVKVKGLGTFKLVEVSERESIDVNTGERIQINGHGKVVFTPDNSLKDLVNRPFAHFQTVVLNEETDINELEQVGEETMEAEENNEQQEIAPIEPAPLKDATTEEPLEDEHDILEANKAEVENSEEEEQIEEISKENTEDEVQPTPSDTIENEKTDHHQQEETGMKQEDYHQCEEDVQRQVTYVVREDEHKIWKTIAIVLIVGLLMTASYFAGYFRLFCPCETGPAHPTEEVTVQTRTNDNATLNTPEQILSKTETTEDSSIVENTKIDTTALTKVDKNSVESQNQSTEVEANLQLEGGKYTIVGTKAQHQVRTGETLRTIARKYYGSKGYAPYIIAYNQLSNPNNIEVGTNLNIPELKAKK